jgi:glycosyltransferase involved in cell wall biosynthesis
VPSTLLLVENASVPRDPRVWAECRTLRDNGWDVFVVCPRRHDDDPPSEVIDGIRIHRFGPFESRASAAGYIAEYAVSLHRIRRIVRGLSRSHEFDVVHAANPPDLLLASAVALRRRGVAMIFDHHDLSPELYAVKFGRRGALYRALLAGERIAFALSDVVISTNESFRHIALTRGRKRAEDVFVVRNGPDPNVFRPVPPDPSVRNLAQHVLGYVGVMGRQDGVLEALDALSVLARTRTDWHAVFVGNGEMLESARQRAAASGISSHVTFTGFVDGAEKIVEILSSCDVSLSPEPKNDLNSRSTLIKVAEAMAVARPVVAFDLTETRFTLGPAGTYAADDSERAFAAAISQLLDAPDQRREKGELGRRRVVERFSWKSAEPHLLAAYDRAIHSTRRTSRVRAVDEG